MGARTETLRPMRNLLVRLPMLPLTRKQEIDFPAADPALLVTIAEDAETTMNVIHHGVGAIGHLLAHSAVVIEDGTISADCVEHLGYLLSELGDLVVGCMTLATRCRLETSDYQPK